MIFISKGMMLMKTKKAKEKKTANKEKKKITLNSIKEFFQELVKETKTIIGDNKIVLFYIIGATLNGIILRAFTIGKAYAYRPILGDIIITLIFVSL